MQRFAPILAVSALLAAPAVGLDRVNAADLSTKAAPIPYVAPFSWTGLYVGGEIGGAFTSGTVTDLLTALQTGAPLTTNPSDSGFIGGGVVRMLYEIKGTTLVVGNELTWDRNSAGPGSWLGTGELAACLSFGQWLPCVTAGAAYQSTDLPITPAGVAVNDKGLGWTVGVGLDYAVNSWLDLGIKYNYISITGPEFNFVPIGTVLATSNNINKITAVALLHF